MSSVSFTSNQICLWGDIVHKTALGFALPATEKSVSLAAFLALILSYWRKIQLAFLVPLWADHVLNGVSFNPLKTVTSIPLRAIICGQVLNNLILHLGHNFPFLSFVFESEEFLF